MVLVYIDAVAHLIGSNLRVNPYFIQEAGMRPAHNLEVYPLKAYLGIPAMLATESGDVGHHPERSDAGLQ